MRGKMKKFIGAVAVLFVAALFVIVLWNGKFLVGALLSYAEDNRSIIVTILLALFVVKGCSGLLLYSVLVFATGLMLPLPWAIVVNVVGTIICFSISYLLGRRMENERLEEMFHRHPKLAKYIRGNGTGKQLVCFSLRMAGISAEATGIVYGLMRTSYSEYIWPSLMGVAPGMLCVTVAGWLRDVHSPWFWILQGTNLLFVPLGIWVLTRKGSREKYEELQPEDVVVE